MTRIDLTSLTLVASTILVGAVAHADPPAQTDGSAQPAARSHVPAVQGGLEIAIALSAARSTGDIGDGMTAGDLIGSAGQLDLEIGHRVTPNLTLAFYSNGQALAQANRDGRSTYTGAAGIEAAFHARPDNAIDPWISIGTGVRAYLIDDGDYTLGVGAELVRLQLGLDLRSSEHVAFGPVIGASASLYGAEKQPMEDFHELSGKGITWTLTAGVAARFDVFN